MRSTFEVASKVQGKPIRAKCIKGFAEMSDSVSASENTHLLRTERSLFRSLNGNSNGNGSNRGGKLKTGDNVSLLQPQLGNEEDEGDSGGGGRGGGAAGYRSLDDASGAGSGNGNGETASRAVSARTLGTFQGTITTAGQARAGRI